MYVLFVCVVVVDRELEERVQELVIDNNTLLTSTESLTQVQHSTTLYILHYTYYTIYYTIYTTLHKIYYTTYTTLYILHYILYILHYINYAIYTTLLTICSTLYILHYIYYTHLLLHYIYYTIPHTPLHFTCPHYNTVLYTLLQHITFLCCHLLLLVCVIG